MESMTEKKKFFAHPASGGSQSPRRTWGLGAHSDSQRWPGEEPWKEGMKRKMKNRAFNRATGEKILVQKGQSGGGGRESGVGEEMPRLHNRRALSQKRGEKLEEGGEVELRPRRGAWAGHYLSGKAYTRGKR